MPLPLELKIEGASNCLFSDFSIDISGEETSNSAEFTIFEQIKDFNTIIRGDLKADLKAEIFINGALVFTGETESPTRTVSKTECYIEISLKSKGNKAAKTTAKLKDGEMQNAKISDILEELVKNSGLEIDTQDIDENNTIIRETTLNLEYLDRKLHNVTRNRGIHLFEMPDGKLKATNKKYDFEGCDLIQGVHFDSIKHKEGNEKSTNKIKGMGARNLSPETEFEAIFTPEQEVDVKLEKDGELYLFFDGDQTPQSLKSASQYNANRRAGADKETTLVFGGFYAPNGDLWRIRTRHKIYAPLVGLDEFMIVKKISIKGNKNNVQTTLTLSPETSLSNKKDKEVNED
jgi:prophage tail gpP-like protein